MVKLSFGNLKYKPEKLNLACPDSKSIHFIVSVVKICNIQYIPPNPPSAPAPPRKRITNITPIKFLFYNTHKLFVLDSKFIYCN